MKPNYYLPALFLYITSTLIVAQTAIPAGTNSGTYNAISAAPTTYILNSGDTRSLNGSSETIAFGAAATGGTYTLTIDGSLLQTGSGRAIRTANVSASTGHTFNLNVGSTGFIRATSDDAVQGRFTGSGNFIFNVDNQGTIYSGPNIAVNPTAPITTGRALNFTVANGGTINNGSLSNTAALLKADGQDAVRLGSNMTMNNYGTVRGNSVVNDASSNNSFNSAPNNSIAENYSTAEGVSFETGANSTLNNYGTISGSRHGVESAETATNVTINNYTGGVIVGRNGSGVGFDSTSTSATNVTILNNGEIRGDYAGAGNIIDRTGNASFTNDGDGDGIDIDGAVTIINNGLVHSTGAGGFDTGGRANSAEGIAIGGGSITNNATGIIRGANRGILVNNDSNLNRSAATATTILNSGTIEGQNGYGIRFEGNFADTITNSGSIIGTGAIPVPTDTVLRQNGVADPANGTLNGTVYGAGSARFIRGDGAAIQTGEGDDTVNNSGNITGNNGRAISLEGGNDALNITGSSAGITGGIDGGVGSDTLNFNLTTAETVFNFAGTIVRFETTTVASGKVTINGTLAFTLGSAVAGSGYDQIAVSVASGSSFTLGGASSLSLDVNFTPLNDTEFILLAVADGSSVSGTFADLEEGEQFTLDNQVFTISYAGGDGNDVSVTAVPEPSTYAAFALGALGLFVARKLRRRAV